MEIYLATPEDTEALGNSLAMELPRHGVRALLFKSALGMGKTTLIRALVAALPGGENAEAASPSFNLCNLYPTTPPVAHFDLYRQEEGMADESLLDFLEDGRHVVLIEWAERLPEYALPPERLECVLTVETCEDTTGCGQTTARRAVFLPFGSAAEALLNAMRV